MIRFIVFAALALAITTPAEAMSPPPLPQSDGIARSHQNLGMAPRSEASQDNEIKWVASFCYCQMPIA